MKPQLIIVLSLFLMACVQVNPPRVVSSEEKAQTYLQMGLRYLELGKLKIAKDSLEKSLDEESENVIAHNALAVLYERIHKFADAKSHYEYAISLDNESPQPKNNYGRFLCSRGQYDEGLKHLNGAINLPLNNRKWFALTNAGLCYVKKENSAKAESYFRAALKLNPNYPPALLEMIKISYFRSKHMSTRAFLQRYLSFSPDTAQTLWYSYQTERALYNDEAAEKYRHKLLTDFPNSAESERVR